jgi:hypothetical protein
MPSRRNHSAPERPYSGPVSDDIGWLDQLTSDGRRELLSLVGKFLETHRRLTEQSQLARLESDVLGGSKPEEVVTFLTAHALHAAKAAELQLTVGDVAAKMAALLRKEIGLRDD